MQPRFRLCRIAALTLLVAGSAAAQPNEALFEKARAAQAAGNAAEAEAGYREYLRRYGPRAEVLANLGALLARKEDSGGAIQHYQQALKLDPSLTPLHLNLGLAHFKQGHAAEAVAAFDVFLHAQPGNRQAMQLRAMALVESGRYADAEAQYKALGPGDPSVALGLATALLRQRKTAEARAVLDPLIERGDSAELQLTLGQALLNEGRLDEALAAFEKVRAISPAFPSLRLHVGSVYWRQRKTQEAISEWRAELAARPGDFEATYTLGAALSLNPATQAESERLLRAAASARPRNARANYQLAKLIWQKSKSQEAAVFLDRATIADPEFREAFFLYGTVLQALGRKPEAARAFARVKQLSERDLERQRDLFSESQ
ncbi:MAG: tetratricopeptide repeat protein [Bryobacteraceae bacterium]